ncbi:sugar ABC transporter substrate-binding protein [Saccharomonospora piscinae]|uniref:Sugar ABC transporter substrate-binding protein n=1 Tax=Saccharomonospora piscinae TaxID=687388 RepID=A0A1V9AA56_SACPI|nr:substrate-binding domain-containing protein [Saccharomonospora piscinae]OQO94005.1 sugar ABC transporter substrate-binding protein [Saccharomonospora piscinae]TLW95177.1 sugar ABC transporter substrate-binding protein [Saccharomonospora piscinae]
MRRRFPLRASAAALGALLILSACGANAGGGSGDSDDSASGAEGGDGELGTVGVILPETASSARWEGFDKPMLEEALRAEGFEPDVQNAQGDVQKFSTLADGMIAQGVSVLVIASINSEVGGAVASKAQAAGIPTIDYDRLNLGGSSEYYVSFDNVRVGELQGEGMAQALEDEPGAQVIEIEGAPTDNNATLFHEGQRNVLQPLYDSGDLELVQSQPIDDWNNQEGGQVFEQILTSNGGEVDGVVAANDGLALAVITVLRKYGLNGTVPVTGQDATAEGLRAILRGDQYMTVFKPVKEEAEATAKLAAALAEGDTAAADEIAGDVSEDPEGDREVASVLLEPYLITKDSVKRVVDEGYVSAEDVCIKDVADVCSELGIG